MSRSNIVKLICLVFLTLPFFAQGKTISLNEQQWEILVLTDSLVSQTPVRNDFDLVQMSSSALTGTKTNPLAQLLDNQTIISLEEITKIINQPTRDASLIIENNYATQFDPGQTGQAVDMYVLRGLLVSDMTQIELPVVASFPPRPLNETNDLGISELVASGVSDFSGSPSNRIVNIKVGAKKFNGIIIKQGEEFSFNKYLGEVDAKHGFLPELVIKPAGVTPEFGGGLCQVSTTTFRAAMNAGLPITARRNHSFAVQYYAPQGTDATIYPGASDLKFINNLSSAVLIRTRIEGRKLYFDFYGTKDDRTVAFEGPVQYDKKPDGSMKATWTRHVTLNGQTTDQTFKSTYLPPALFHPEPKEPTPPPTPPLTQ